MATIKAVRIHSYGGPEVLRYEDAPKPKPAEDEVLIRVHGAGVNPVDWKVRAGYLKAFIPYSLPLIPGWDVSGVVEEMGANVNRLKPGDEVYSRPDLTRNGAYAEYVTVRDSEVALKPRSIDHIHAAAIPLAALTAWQALFDAGRLTAGQTVLIHAAAGGVGTFAVQFAIWKGAHVIGTASGRNQSFLRELGTDDTIDYEKTRFEDVVRHADIVLDALGEDIQKRSWQTLRTGGTLVSIVNAPSPEEAAAHGVWAVRVGVQANPQQLAEIAHLVDSGKVRSIVETVVPLAEARRAHELIQTGHVRGKIVLRIAQA